MTSIFRRPSRGRPPHPDILTPAEWRVLEEVRDGRSNPEIAERLGISRNTVKTHISRILDKLDLRDRGQLSSWRGEPVIGRPRRSFLLAPFGWLTAKAVGAVAVTALAGVLVVGLVVAMESGRVTPADSEASPTATASSASSLVGTVIETGFGWHYVIDRVEYDDVAVRITYSVAGDTDGLQETGLPTSDGDAFLPFPGDAGSNTVEFARPVGDEVTVEFGAAARGEESPTTIQLALGPDGWSAEDLQIAVPSASAVEVREEVEGYTSIRVSAPVAFTGRGSPGNFATLLDDLGNEYELYHGSHSPNRGYSQWDFVGPIAGDATTLEIHIPGSVSVESGTWTVTGTLR